MQLVNAMISTMGPLRLMLHGAALVLILMLPFSEPSWNPEGINLLLGAVVPALAPIVAIVIMLDVLMSKVQQADAQLPAQKIQYRNIIRANLITAIVLTAFWIAAFNQVLL